MHVWWVKEHMKDLFNIFVIGQSLANFLKSEIGLLSALHCAKIDCSRYSLCSKKRARDKGAIKRRRILCKNCEILALGTTTISAAQLELDINLAVGGVRLSLKLGFCIFFFTQPLRFSLLRKTYVKGLSSAEQFSYCSAFS